MCDRKYMFGDKSTFGSSYNGQNMPKKGQINEANYPSFNVKKVHNPFKNLHIF